MGKNIFLFVVSFLGIILVSFIILVVLASKYNGLWKIEPYGLCLKANFGFVKVYQITDSTVTRIKEYEGVIINKYMYCALGKLELEKKDNVLNLINRGSQTVYSANKAEKDFLAQKTTVSNDPRKQFLMFYEAFKENYAFFDLYNVDIDEKYKHYSGMIDENTKEDALFEYMSDMISGLNDDHIFISAGEKTYSPYKNPSEFWADSKKVQELVDLIKAKYLTGYKKFKDSSVRYATLSDDIGYLVLPAMGTETLDQAKTTKKALNQVIPDLQDMRILVIDIRFNSGGFDAASLAIAGYFTKTPYLAYKKQAYYKGTYTKPQEVYVYPEKIYYDGDIILLTSKFSVSAAETFARALVANPERKVLVLGEETKGFYSDCIPRITKKNWYFGLSNERYLSGNDTAFEGTSVNPDVYLPVQYSDVQKEIDPAIEWILEHKNQIMN